MPQTWRSIYRVHPAADVFPMMPDEELDALAADIKANGLRQPIVVCEDGDALVVLDGRNRLTALERLGVAFPECRRALSFHPRLPNGQTPTLFESFTAIDPFGQIDRVGYVISANIRRRHLTKEQRAELIVKAIEAGAAPTNDRAKVARSFNTKRGAKGGSTKDPVLEQAVAVATKHGISKRTVQNARAKLHGTPKTKPAPLASTTKPTSILPQAVEEAIAAELAAARRQIDAGAAVFLRLLLSRPGLTEAEVNAIDGHLSIFSNNFKAAMATAGRRTLPASAPDDAAARPEGGTPRSLATGGA